MELGDLPEPVLPEQEPTDPHKGDKLITPAQVSGILDLSRSRVDVWARLGRLRYIRTPTGRRMYYLSSVLEAKEKYPLHMGKGEHFRKYPKEES